VFISSESAINASGGMIHYGMTKTAQLAVSRGLAESCAGTAVTVNAVLPRPTHSPGVGEFVNQISGGQSAAAQATNDRHGWLLTTRPRLPTATLSGRARSGGPE